MTACACEDGHYMEQGDLLVCLDCEGIAPEEELETAETLRLDLPVFPAGMELATARELLVAGIVEGTHCVCCGQFAKVYERQIYDTMAKQLIYCYRRAGRADYYLPDLISKSCGDYAKMRYWGIIEQDKPRSGWWRITEYGELFVLGRVRVPKFIGVYDRKFVGFLGTETADIRDSLGIEFDYDEVMRSDELEKYLLDTD